MNKKGFLLAEETLKIIIALISLGFLVYFLGALYFANQDSKELEQAKASLEFLVKEINDGRKEVTIFNPSPSFDNFGVVIGAWDLISFSSGKTMPNSCSNLKWNSCLCICKEVDDCDEKGICRESDITVEGGVIEIAEVPLTLKIKEKTISR